MVHELTVEALKSAKEAAEEVRAGKRTLALPSTHDIADVPVFAAGTWNGDSYSTDDLDAMVSAFDETKQFMKPYLKLGHDGKQSLAQRDGLPAVGWIDRLYRRGRTLYADFKQVPQKIMDLVRAGAYKKISAEIFVNFDFNGKRYPFLLKAASFLGSDWPGVSTIDDIIALYALGGEVKAFEGQAETKTFEAEKKKWEETEMEELQKKLAEAEARVRELSEKLARVDTLAAENKTLKDSLEKATKMVGDLEAKTAEFARSKQETEINAALDKAVADKKITPAQKPLLFTLMVNTSNEKKFAVAGEEKTPQEILLQFIAGNSVDVNDEEHSGAGKKAGDIDAKVKEYQEKHEGMSYKDALIAVSPRNQSDED